MWEVCLPASSSSSSPNSRNRQGRLQLQGRESKGGRSQLGGGVGLGGKIQRQQETPTPEPDGGTHTDADTFSHCRPGPCTQPTLRRHPDTLSQSCQLPEHSPDTHGDPGPPSHPPASRVGSRQPADGGWRREQREERMRASERMCSQSPGSLGYQLPHSFPKTQ